MLSLRSRLHVWHPGEFTIDSFLTKVIRSEDSDVIWNTSNRLCPNELLDGREWHVVESGMQVCHRDAHGLI